MFIDFIFLINRDLLYNPECRIQYQVSTINEVMGYNPTCKEFIVWLLGEMDELIVVVGLGITDVGHGIPEWGILTQPGVRFHAARFQ